MLQGRDIGDRDDQRSAPVVVLSEAAARRFWPGADPIGKRLRLGGGGSGAFAEVVGVARDTRVRTLGEEPRPYVYRSLWQASTPFVSIVARTTGDPGPLLSALRREILAVDESLPIMELKTMREHLELMLFAPRMGGALLAAFGGVGVLLATLGLYGVVAYTVARRTREVGVRIALGAQPRDVVWLVIRQGMVLIGVGMAIGLALAVVAALPLERFLFGVSPTDPAAFLGVSAVLGAIGFVATLIPAGRAAGLDPVEALRHE